MITGKQKDAVGHSGKTPNPHMMQYFVYFYIGIAQDTRKFKGNSRQ